MTLIDRLLLANLARVLRLADPVPPRVRDDAVRAGLLRHPVTVGDQLGLQLVGA